MDHFGLIPTIASALCPPIEEATPEMQRHLEGLLHGLKCEKHTQYQQCFYPYCENMRSVLDHMITCQQGTLCHIPLCLSSKNLLLHWSRCSKQYCPLCTPVNQISLILKIDVRHLASLLHAQKCVKQAAQECTNPDCEYGKYFLSHLATCREYIFCRESFCLPSKRILWHWKVCTEQDCPICSPLRQDDPIVSQSSRRQLLNSFDASGPEESTKDTSSHFTAGENNETYGTASIVDQQQRKKPSSTAVHESYVAEASSEEKENVRSYLKMLVHALNCAKSSRVPAESGKECSSPACTTMKKLFHHINTCHEGKSCLTALCSETKPILSHLRQCTNRDCSYCSLLPQTNPNAHPTQQPLVGDLRGVQPGTTVAWKNFASKVIDNPMIRNPMTMPQKQLTIGHSGLQGQVATEPYGQGKTRSRSPEDLENRNEEFLARGLSWARNEKEYETGRYFNLATNQQSEQNSSATEWDPHSDMNPLHQQFSKH